MRLRSPESSYGYGNARYGTINKDRYLQIGMVADPTQLHDTKTQGGTILSSSGFVATSGGTVRDHGNTN